MMEDFDDGLERCRNRHIRTEANTIREVAKNGRTRRRCRDCRRESRAARAGRPAGLDGFQPRPLVNYDSLVGEAKRTVDRFDRGLHLVRPQCVGRSNEFTDYDEDNIPTPASARELCVGCPLIDLCQDAAMVMKHGWGVFGGEAWVYGQVYINGTK